GALPNHREDVTPTAAPLPTPVPSPRRGGNAAPTLGGTLSSPPPLCHPRESGRPRRPPEPPRGRRGHEIGSGSHIGDLATTPGFVNERWPPADHTTTPGFGNVPWPPACAGVTSSGKAGHRPHARWTPSRVPLPLCGEGTGVGGLMTIARSARTM